jgi:hypothetical protein
MVEILEESGQLVVRIGQHEYARYHFGANRMKPYLYPLRAVNGLSLLADAPTDHRHHHGIWVGHGRVEETDCWQERHNSGRIVHRRFAEVESGETEGHFTEECDWLDTENGLLLRDTRSFRFYDMPAESRIFDFEITLTAPEGKTATLQPTNEAGIPHIRVAESLSPRGGGLLINAEGKRNERQTYRQRSNWVDCSGKLGRIVCGIAVFDHPDNPEHPTPWFTRDYGPFSPNYGFFLSEPIEIDAERPLRLRYRFYTHSGDAEEGRVAEMWEAYVLSAAPPPRAARPPRNG